MSGRNGAQSRPTRAGGATAVIPRAPVEGRFDDMRQSAEK